MAVDQSLSKRITEAAGDGDVELHIRVPRSVADRLADLIDAEFALKTISSVADDELDY